MILKCRKNILTFIFFLIPLALGSEEFMKDYLDYREDTPLPQIDSDLVYGEGSSVVTTELDDYQNILPNKPIEGSIFITHATKNRVDIDSFQIGSKQLKVQFVQETAMSTSSNIVVSIYSFQIEGLPVGIHTLPSISVNVGGDKVLALPLVIQVTSSS